MNIGIVGAALLLLTGSAAAQDGGKVIPKTTITLGTATPGGGFPLYGNAFAEVMNEADPALAIEPRNTKGSNENIPLLEEGKLDLALVAGEPSYEAFMGIRAAAHQSKNPDRDVFEPGNVRGARRQFLQNDTRPGRQARRVSARKAPASDPVALSARWSRTEAGRGFPVGLSRRAGADRPWCSMDGPRRCGARGSAGRDSRP